MLKISFDKTERAFYLNDGLKKFDCEIQEDDGFSLDFNNKEDFDFVIKNLSELAERVNNVAIESYVNWNGVNVSVEVNFIISYRINSKISFNEDWNWQFSRTEYLTEFARIQGSQAVDVEFFHHDGLEIDDLNTSIEIYSYWDEEQETSTIELFKQNFSIINKFHQEAIERLTGNFTFNSITALFNFTEELKTACEQYLLYFAQFLKDLGINATSSLKEEAGKVLFSVTPTDDIEALDKIREALAVYLKLPESPIIYNESFAAMRLQQQIDNLHHSQRMAEREIRSSERELRLAQTVIESQDKIILQKDSLIEQQSKIIDKITSKSIMMDSVENKEEFEKVFDGLEFGESKELKEKLGIKFNPVTSLKSLGKKLMGDDKITSLNLDKEVEK
jgi:hypothetical protein